MTLTMTRLYATNANAMEAVNALRHAGFNDEHVSLVGRSDQDVEPTTTGMSYFRPLLSMTLVNRKARR